MSYQNQWTFLNKCFIFAKAYVNTEDRRICTLSDCGHTFCLAYILEYLARSPLSSSSSKNQAPCSVCRKTFVSEDIVILYLQKLVDNDDFKYKVTKYKTVKNSVFSKNIKISFIFIFR